MKILTKAISIRFPSKLHNEIVRFAHLKEQHPSTFIRDSLSKFLSSLRDDDHGETK